MKFCKIAAAEITTIEQANSQSIAHGKLRCGA